ncbi:MAG: DUF554 domain-containing protein [Chloroflexota bacterium]|nr:DUF554 domain-containing protein [Chloroflexota bacterium]
MIGTLLNTAAIIAGSLLGIFLGQHLSEKVRDTIINGLGLFTLAYGLMTFLGTSNPLVPLGGLLVGALLGEWWKIEEGLEKLGKLLRRAFLKKDTTQKHQTHFVEGFVSASLVFIIGPMAILGSVQNGLTGEYELLAIKSILDGFASIAFASLLGIGVAFSALSILIYQGSITLLSRYFSQILSDAMVSEMTAVGGLILMAIAISSLLSIKKIRTGSYLPALLVTPLIVLFLEHFFGGY